MVLDMNKIAVTDKIQVENMIYEIRGKQVMLDSDLAKLYECANGTKTINQAVKRHINRFPERFMFQLTEDEYNNLRFQVGTANNMTRSLPYAFTEQGVAMLSAVLRTSVAEEISIRIMDAFVAMRKYISSNLIEQKYINNLVLEDHEKIKTLEISFDKLQEKQQVNAIFFKGQIYDAYSLMKNILNSSKKELIVIDNYIDKKLLDVLSDIDKNILIITNQYNNSDYEKYKKQYSNVDLKINNSFHDRFIIVDKKILYHCGASFKDLGKKCFAITLVEDNEILYSILKKI